MGIYMVGIDHSKAALDVRSVFSFTKKSMLNIMEELSAQKQVEGVIVLSTCNRMEIWVDAKCEPEQSLYEQLCDFKQVEPQRYKEFFRERQEEEAISHLFHLACGLKSQILGEDQIVTQVGDALTFSREHGFSDSVLEVLFRKAVTAAKKVKTEVVFPKGNSSVITNAIAKMREKGIAVEGKTCMIIGNGEMGKTAARAFFKENANVMVTVRQYQHGMVEIPKGCVGIDYNDRMDRMEECDFVVSATTSPHYTVTRQMIEEQGLCKPIIFLDLAVPRDIEPKIGKIEHMSLYDIDDFKADKENEKLRKAKNKAEVILLELIEEFHNWQNGHDVIPRIQFVKEEAVKDVNLRLTKQLRNLPLESQEKEILLQSIDKAAEKVINKMIFGLRDCLEQEAFLDCVEGLEQLYEQ